MLPATARVRTRAFLRSLGGLLLPMGEPIEGALGTVVTGGLMAAYADPPVNMPEVAAAALVTVAAYWLTHVYAEMVGHPPTSGRAPFKARFRHSLRANWALVRSAFPLLAVAFVARGLGAAPETALGVAVWCAVLILVIEGVVTAHRHGIRGYGLLAAAVAAGLIGLVLVVVKTSVD